MANRIEPGFQLKKVLAEKATVNELLEATQAGRLKSALRAGVSAEVLEEGIQRHLHPTAAAPRPRAGLPDMGFIAEAIVLEFGRPALIVQDGTFKLPESSAWRGLLSSSRSNIEAAIASVARVELLNHHNFQWCGTAWVVAPNVLATNRHVAKIFAEGNSNGGFVFKQNIQGQPIDAQVDFFEEHLRDTVAEIRVTKVRYIAPNGAQHPDVALLEVVTDGQLPPPLELSAISPKEEDSVGVIGYPAFDSRNGSAAMERYFEGVYDVKRFAPGKVQVNDNDQFYFLSDYTSLGGNSGSAVINLENGDVVGLHFAGRFKEANYAVGVDAIKAALSAGSVSMAGVAVVQPSEGPQANKTYPASHYTKREGYQADFLGSGHTVKLPGFGYWKKDVAPVANSEQNGIARYQHFSVAVSKSRRLALFSAVNIDGKKQRRVPRTRRWYLDGRIAPEYQTGNEMYKNNSLDRGHLVRRLDPVWGSFKAASVANDDSFHYSNAAPQHAQLNQRDWLDLESLILDHADAEDMKLSVFTGPVLADTDRKYRGVQLPEAFWKVVTMVNGESGKLATLAFILGQSHMVDDLEESILQAGEMQLYQVPVSLVTKRSRLNFEAFNGSDQWLESSNESVSAVRRVVGVESLLMPRRTD